MNVHQLDSDFLLQGGVREVYEKGHLQVLVAAPDTIPDKHTAKWATDLCPVKDISAFGTSSTGQWELVPDYRKDKLYLTSDGSEYKINDETEIGKYKGYGELPDWLTDIERPSQFHNWKSGAWVLDTDAELANAKEQKLLEIDRGRDDALLSGFEYNGHVFNSDQKSIQRINAIATLALMDPEYTTPYITKTNDVIELNNQDISGLGLAAAAHESSMVFQARHLKDQVLAATDKEVVDAIVWVAP